MFYGQEKKKELFLCQFTNSLRLYCVKKQQQQPLSQYLLDATTKLLWDWVGVEVQLQTVPLTTVEWHTVENLF